jgi:hypothetical protein
MMRVLLDTNIIIHREASKIVNQDIGILFNWPDRLHDTKCVHPLTVSELGMHLDPVTVNTMQAKLANYQLLQTPAPLHTVTSEQRSTLKTGSLLNSKPSTILFCRAGCSRSRKSETFAPIMEGCGIRIYPADHI